MRILLISDHSDPLAEIGSKEAGGQNIYVYYLARYLGRLGIFVDIFTRWDRLNKIEVAKVNHHIRVIRVKAGPRRYVPKEEFISLLPEFTANILRRIEQEETQYDLVHSNYWLSGLVGMEISKRLNLPHFFVFHSIGQVRLQTFQRFDQIPNPDLFAERLKSEAAITGSVDRIIGTSPVEKATIMDIFKVAEEKIKVIPIGVDTRIFRPTTFSPKSKLLMSPDEKNILYVGRLEWRKGIGTLLRSFALAQKEYPSSKLYVVGGSTNQSAKMLEAEELERQSKLISELNIQGQVVYVGPVSQKQLFRYYNAADVVVVPSYYEPFGIVPLESMACGTPVVASRTGGLQFTIRDGVTGHLAEPRNHIDLAEKLKLVLAKARGHYSLACLSRINRHFNWEKISREYAEFFEEFTNRKEML
ncbi:MAG: glycosyltransferase [Patescibacteria group bacterium]|jgi:glycosyltransferase involved in cell wall biosynthesis